MIAPKKVGTEEMLPVFAEDISAGEYSVEVESSSSMFRIAEAKLFVTEDENGAKSMKAHLTMGGKSYTKLFAGTALEASDSNGKGEILPFENEKGAVCFEFPVTALNKAVKCAAFSKNKLKWYDRDILFNASSLPEEFLTVTAVKQQESSLKDGSYLINVKLSGGSGKAQVKSPAKITVKNGLAQAEIEWSSANYDYMKVNRQRFDADSIILEKGGNSTFYIPVNAFNKKIPVFADTLAMSKPHEILYYLEFDESSAKKAGSISKSDIILLVWAALVILSVVFVRFKMTGKKK
ncbi:hypothetical protein [Treponema sp.]|uniref:hypothetical protein n=1 Tax=Treponema sp. TaxID=166 RepID=UPI00388FF8D1